jgi:hypothetical protein
MWCIVGFEVLMAVTVRGHRVVLREPDVLEGHIASIFRVED